MSAVHKFSNRVIDYAERVSNIADAAEGKHRHSGRKLSRWVVLPASGAALYALVRSEFFSRQAKEVMGEAKTLAAELPDDLMSRVHQSVEAPAGNGSSRSAPASRRKGSASKASRSRKTSSAGKARSGTR